MSASQSALLLSWSNGNNPKAGSLAAPPWSDASRHGVGLGPGSSPGSSPDFVHDRTRGLAHEPAGADQQGCPGLCRLDAHSPLAHDGASACLQRFTALRGACWQVLDPLHSHSICAQRRVKREKSVS